MTCLHGMFGITSWNLLVTILKQVFVHHWPASMQDLLVCDIDIAMWFVQKNYHVMKLLDWVFRIFCLFVQTVDCNCMACSCIIMILICNFIQEKEKGQPQNLYLQHNCQGLNSPYQRNNSSSQNWCPYGQWYTQLAWFKPHMLCLYFWLQLGSG